MIDIIIVNWNSGDFLKNCINSVINTSNNQFINRIFIIDNNSTDNSIQQISSHEKIRFIKNKKNLGFSKACNQGFKMANAEYVLLLNPDTELYNNTLADAIAYMDQHPDTDVMGVQLLDEKGNITASCARFPTPLAIFYESSGLSKVAPRIFRPATLMKDWDHKESRFVDQIIGAFMFMRGKVFEKAGYFDERFFVYYEELDFSLSLHKKGGTSFFNSAIKALHVGEGTTGNIKAFRLFLFLQSRLFYAKKNFSAWGYFVVCVSSYVIEPFTRLIMLLTKAGFKEIKELVTAYKMLCKAAITGRQPYSVS